MVEPVSAAASGASRALVGALTKRLASRSGTKLGSKDERREVYVRFQNAVIAAISHAEHQRLLLHVVYHRWMGKRGALQLAQMSQQLLTEILQAYMELRLVANPKALEAGDDLLTALNGLLDVITGSEAEFGQAAERVGEAQRTFVDVCRDDLWYLPQWWQLYRWTWWKTRLANVVRRRRLSSASAREGGSGAV